jgi:hypothetical protein
MLNNFDLYCENILTEGRKADDKKKFTVDVEKVKSHINEIGTKHHHYVHDKGHFTSLLDDINPNHVYTPKSFQEHIKSCMKGKGKSQISDGYAKLFYTFLSDRVDSPFLDYVHKPEVEEHDQIDMSDSNVNDELFGEPRDEDHEDEYNS